MADSKKSFADIGPIRFVAVDEDGRRFPCACHREPAGWMMVMVRPFGDGRMAYCLVPFPDRLPQRLPPDLLFENALATLADIPEHPELYREGF